MSDLITNVRVRISDVPPGGAVAVPVNAELTIAVFHVEGAYYAIDNRCPHKGGLLANGTLDGVAVRCPRHGFKVDLATGVVLTRRGMCARTFAVELGGEELVISVPPVTREV